MGPGDLRGLVDVSSVIGLVGVVRGAACKFMGSYGVGYYYV